MRGGSGYPVSGYSASLQSYDDTNASESAASTPRSRSSYAASFGQRDPPSRGTSGSGVADFRSGKLRRPPRAQSSGSALRSALLDEQQLSFTDSITNTTNSSETSPRKAWQQGSSSSQQLPELGDGPGSSLHAGEGAYGIRTRSGGLLDDSGPLPHSPQRPHDPFAAVAAARAAAAAALGSPPGNGDSDAPLRGPGGAASVDEDVGNGAASTYGGASSVGGGGFGGGFGGGGFGPNSSSHGGPSGRHGGGPSGGDPPSSASQMSLLQLQRAIEKIMVSDGEMYAKLQAGLKGIHSLARETNRLTVARDVTGATCINQYVVVKTLGRGSYGKVKLCLNTLDGQLYAIKMMNRSCLLRTLQRPRAGLRKSARRSVSASMSLDQQGHVQRSAGSAGAGSSAAAAAAAAAAVAAAAAAGLTSGGLCSDEANDVNREIAILKKLTHPNVVKLYEVIDPPGSQYMMLVMEFLEKGPVLQTHNQAGFGSLPEEVAADYFRQAVAGLEYLHFHKVVHGDIKPENLLVSSNGELKISDFGCSRMADGQSSQTRLTGTPAFTAPELVAGNAADPFAADVWALGACLFCFIYGRLPFQGGCVLDVFKAIANEPLQLPDDVVISAHLHDLFMRLFDKSPDTRITLQGIMSHPWVTDEGRVPLHSCADSGLGLIEVTAQEQLGAIDRASVVSMIRARLKEKVFRSHEYIFQAGQPMNCVYFVMSGAVEILRCATAEDAEREFSGNTSIEHSFTVDIDESLMLDCSVVGEGLMPPGAVNGRLHIDRLKARDLKHRHRGHLMGHLLEGMEVVVDVKGPGQVVGEVFMQEAPPPCTYSARARGEVLALKLTQENYLRALASMYIEAEHGARASAHSGCGATRGRPMPAASASSPGLLGSGGLAASLTAAAAGGAAAATPPGGGAAGGQRHPHSPQQQLLQQQQQRDLQQQPELQPGRVGSGALSSGGCSPTPVGRALPGASGAAAAAAAVGGHAAAAAVPGGMPGSSSSGAVPPLAEAQHPHSVCPSLGGSSGGRDPHGPSTGTLTATTTSSSSLTLGRLGSGGTAVGGGGGGSTTNGLQPHTGLARGGPAGLAGAAGGVGDDSAPLQLLGSGGATDEEEEELMGGGGGGRGSAGGPRALLQERGSSCGGSAGVAARGGVGVDGDGLPAWPAQQQRQQL